MERVEDPEIWCTLSKKFDKKPKSRCTISTSSNTVWEEKGSTDSLFASSGPIYCLTSGQKCCLCCQALARYWRQVYKLFSCLLGYNADCNTRVLEAFCDVVKASKELVCDVCGQLNRFLLYLAYLTCSNPK